MVFEEKEKDWAYEPKENPIITFKCQKCDKEVLCEIFDYKERNRYVNSFAVAQNKEFKLIVSSGKFKQEYLCKQCSKKYKIKIVKKSRPITKWESIELTSYFCLTIGILIYGAYLLISKINKSIKGEEHTNWWCLLGIIVILFMFSEWAKRIKRIIKETKKEDK